MALPEIAGIGFLQQPNYPIINGIGIEKQPSLPVINGIDIAFSYPYKGNVFTNKGFAFLISDSKKIALTDRGLAVNLNPFNFSNRFYQLI